MSLTLIDRLFKSGLSTGLMLAVANPITYNFVENTFSKTGKISVDGCPTVMGHLIHTVVFFILLFTMMVLIGYTRPDQMRKPLLLLLKYTFYGTLIFFALTNTEMYKFINNFTGETTADMNGCPTRTGLFLHAIIYFITVFTVMTLPQDC